MLNRKPKRMRRSWVIRHCVVLGVLGALATVLTAWASAWGATSRNSALGRGYAAGQPWGVPVPESWPANPRGATYSTSANYMIGKDGPRFPPPGVRYRVREGLHTGVSVSLTGWTFNNGEDPRYATDAVYMGWPLRSMTHRGPTDARPLPKNTALHFVYNGIPLPEIQWLGLKADRHLPLVPKGGAFLLSVLIYGISIELLRQLVLLRGRLRRWRWRRNNYCLTCGYAIEDLAVCPECGSGDEAGD